MEAKRRDDEKFYTVYETKINGRTADNPVVVSAAGVQTLVRAIGRKPGYVAHVVGVSDLDFLVALGASNLQIVGVDSVGAPTRAGRVHKLANFPAEPAHNLRV